MLAGLSNGLERAFLALRWEAESRKEADRVRPSSVGQPAAYCGGTGAPPRSSSRAPRRCVKAAAKLEDVVFGAADGACRHHNIRHRAVLAHSWALAAQHSVCLWPV